MNEHNMLDMVIQILMAVFGGAARLLNGRDATVMRRAHIISDLFMSAFTGVLLYWVAQALDVNSSWTYALSGIAGWAGPRTINGIVEMVQSKTGIRLTDEANTEASRDERRD